MVKLFAWLLKVKQEVSRMKGGEDTFAIGHLVYKHYGQTTKHYE